MEAAKLQRQQTSSDATSTPQSNLSPAEIKQINDRKRFESLLENSLLDSSLGNDYLTAQQEEENADAVYRGIARLYEGDPAPIEPFAELCSIQNGECIGSSGAERIVPWIKKNSDDYIVIVTDPRPKSVELRSAIRKLVNGAVSEEIVKRVVVINPDSAGENRKFMKRFPGGSAAEKLTVLVDEDLEWMREYTALGEKVSLFSSCV